MADNKKTSPKRELLLEKQVNGYDRINAEDLEACEEYNEKYKVFIDEEN